MGVDDSFVHDVRSSEIIAVYTLVLTANRVGIYIMHSRQDAHLHQTGYFKQGALLQEL